MLVVCSVYDIIKEQSVMVTMNETVADAIRQFEMACSAPHISHIKNDLILYRIGYFDVKELVIEGEDKTILKYGSDIFVDSSESSDKDGVNCGE